MLCAALQVSALHCTALNCTGRKCDPALVVPGGGGDIPSGAQNTQSSDT